MRKASALAERVRALALVDFGTAPKEAFWELLDLLDASGVVELSVKGLSTPLT
jgi:hypothetical protein